MYRCDQCSRVVPAGTRESRVVVETREKTYEPRGNRERERFRRGGRRVTPGRKARRRQVFDKGGRGTEIVKEISVCPDCFAAMPKPEPKVTEQMLDLGAPIETEETELEYAKD
ncbi:MAG: hypothetical protein R3B90_08790 [Planctomycetaceae bacterium]